MMSLMVERLVDKYSIELEDGVKYVIDRMMHEIEMAEFDLIDL